MLVELAAAEYDSVQALFASVQRHQMFCAGVLSRLYPGRVFVDNRENPRSGLVAKDGMWWFLAGDPHNAAFNAAFNTALYDRTITGPKGWGGMLVCDSAAWDSAVPALYAPRTPIRTHRLHYICDSLTFDPLAFVPDGFQIRLIDPSLADSGVEIDGSAAKILQLRQDSPDPDLRAVGVVALHGGRIVAHAVIDTIVQGGGDIGIYTDGAFRRRGLALATSAALIAYALSHGLHTVHWDVESFNAGSIRTAERLGLRLISQHDMLNFVLDPVIHEVNRAWSSFDAGHYEQALAVCREHIGAGDPPAHPHFHYVMARCLADTGRVDEAIEALSQAAQAGWDSPGEALNDFPALAENPLWDGIVAQMETNTQPSA
ncbi:MAG: GNAT family N-acetyltransferase [Chloroflexi bacterium]|nr:GNAT family N-acetyltransferase [Chloroflexota bacterium]